MKHNKSATGHVVALAGGVGGARLADGLAQVLAPDALSVIANTGDDFEHLGLHISPDIDTIMYTLAGINNARQGWGIAGESWAFTEAMCRLGGSDWFALGDQDMATHVLRTMRLRSESLSNITTDFCTRLGINQRIVPMSDDPVRTKIISDEGCLAFQDYFVRRKCVPRFEGIVFDGIEAARPSAGFLAALDNPSLQAIVICPSNPILSIRPIVSLPTISERIQQVQIPIVAVSPFICGDAVKGPAAKILRELGLPVTPEGLLNCYENRVDGLVIDHQDAAFAPTRDKVRTYATNTLMQNAADRSRLANEVLAFANELRCQRTGIAP